MEFIQKHVKCNFQIVHFCKDKEGSPGLEIPENKHHSNEIFN